MSTRRSLALAFATFAIGLVISGLVALAQERSNREQAQKRLEELGSEVVASVKLRLQQYEYGLLGARGAVAVYHEGMTRADFVAYSRSRDYDREFPGARGFGLIWRVKPGEEEAAFVRRARQDDWPSFAVRQLSPHDGERFLIQYIEPVERNWSAVGLDIASETHRRKAAVLALRTGKATLTGLITLVQATGKPQRSYLLLLPIYRPHLPLSSEDAREKAGVGWSYAPLVMDEVFKDLSTFGGEVTVKLKDMGETDPQTFFQTAGTPLAGDGLAFHSNEFSIYGRHWAAEVQPTEDFYAALNQTPSTTLAAALALVSAFAALLVYLLASGRMRTQQMMLARAHRAAIVENSTDAIIVQSLDGHVIDWNPGAEQMFGYSPTEAVGQTLVSLLLPLDRHDEDAHILTNVKGGRDLPAFETTRMRKDGTLVHVSVAASALRTSSGHMVGITKVIRDISESKQAQAVLADLNTRLERLVQARTLTLNDTLHDFRTIMDALPSMIGRWDRNLVNRMANQAYANFANSTPAAMLGQSMQALLGQAMVDQNLTHIEGVLRGEPQTFERTIPPSNGVGERQMIAYYLPDIVDGEVQGFYLLAHDLTELNASRHQLALAERNSAALLDTIHRHAIVSVADRAGNIIEVNDSFCAISGFTREELIGENHRLINSGHHDAAFWERMWSTISSGDSWREEVCNKARDGSIYWVDSMVSPVMGHDGQIEKFISIRTDITSRKRLEADVETSHRLLQENEQFLLDLTDHLPVRMAYLDREGRYEFVNASYCQYLGRLREDIVGATRVSLMDGTGPDEALPFYDAVLKGRAQHLEVEEVMHDQWVCVDTHLVPDLAADGTVKGIYMVGVDITERRQAEAELRQTTALLNAVMSAASQVSIIATTPEGLINVFNAGAQNLLGYTQDEVVRKVSSLKFHDFDELKQRAEVLSAQQGAPVPASRVLIEPSQLGELREWTYVRKDGHKVPVSLGVTAMHDDRGTLVGYLGIARDVRPQKELERSLRHAVHKERSANAAKSQFLANMSHEIRTPMNAVIGLSFLLERTLLDGEQAGLLGKIKTASKSLLALINNILDLSKIEASELKIEHAPFSLTRLLREVSDIVSVQSDARGISFKLEAQGGLPAVLEGDSTRLHQILLNLLTNAIKFTGQGSVRLNVSKVGGSASVPRLRFAVMDSGIGMNEAEMARLFVPFAQADTSTTRRFGGTGLGLSIVKQLVQLMGGQVGVESEPGRGSTFWVEMDLAISEAKAVPVEVEGLALPNGSLLNGIRVLVADDSEINLEVARRILELEGARVSLALNGQEAVDQLMASPDGFDVVLLDLQMPVLDGFDTCRQIRNGLGLTDLVLIALSASTLGSDMDQARTAGVNDFVSKPFDPIDLVACIRRCLPHTAQPPSVSPMTAPLGNPVPDGWPDIAGIDGAEVHRRLGGDQALFRLMLKRLLGEFGDLGRTKSVPELADLASLASHLHKLKGSAGTLGAKSVEQAAGRADKACRAENMAQVGVLLAEVAREVQQLAQAVTPVLEAQDAIERLAGEQAPAAGAAPISDEALASLIEALVCNDLCAIDQVAAQAHGLKQLLGASAYAQWKCQVDDLDFAAAADTLRQMQGH
jgi:PAS domain S-box-containing protein